MRACAATATRNRRGPRRRRRGSSPFRQGHAQRILVHAGDLEFVMQVRPGRITGRADEADRLALVNARAGADAARESGQVRIERRDAAAVPDLHRVAVASASSRRQHVSVGRRQDARSARRGEIHARVRAPVLEDRMETGAEPRAHAREFDRRAQERLGAVAAVERVIGLASFVVFEQYRVMHAAVVHELRREDPARRDQLARLIDRARAGAR